MKIETIKRGRPAKPYDATKAAAAKERADARMWKSIKAEQQTEQDKRCDAAWAASMEAK